MCKEFGAVSYFVYFKAVVCLILLFENQNKVGLIDFGNLAQSLSQESIEPRKCWLLHTAFHDHCTELVDLVLSDTKFQELVAAFLEIDWATDSEINCPSEIDHVFLGHILNLVIVGLVFLFLLLSVFRIRILIRFVFWIGTVLLLSFSK